MNRAAFAISYFRFWSRHVVVQPSDPNVQPVRVKLGAEHWARCAPPPFHQSTLISDHVQDWLRERRARIWYSAFGIACWSNRIFDHLLWGPPRMVLECSFFNPSKRFTFCSMIFI
jgi:hypothetical protein